jgi:hypothetical protein
MHTESFVSNGVDGPLLLKLTVEDLQQELEVRSSLQSKKIISQIERLQVAGPGPSSVNGPFDTLLRAPQTSMAATNSRQRSFGRVNGMYAQFEGAGAMADIVTQSREAFFVANQSLLSVKLTASLHEREAAPCRSGSLQACRLREAETSGVVHKHITLPFPGVTKLAISKSGEYISVQFLEAQRYIIFKLANMRRLDAGHAIDIVWAEGGTQGGADRYAVLQSHANYKVYVEHETCAFCR